MFLISLGNITHIHVYIHMCTLRLPCVEKCLLQYICGTLTCMHTYVYFEAALCREVFVTYVTHKLLDPGVCLDVCGERTLDSKGAVALCALVGFLMGVDSDVAYQVARLLEFLGAVGTLMPSHTIYLQVLSGEVISTLLNSREFKTPQITDKSYYTYC